jgi:hypothetical protein
LHRRHRQLLVMSPDPREPAGEPSGFGKDTEEHDAN